MGLEAQSAQDNVQPLALTVEEEHVVRAVLESLRRIQHGSVQLLVQDRRVVQIDTLEKTRLSRSERLRLS